MRGCDTFRFGLASAAGTLENLPEDATAGLVGERLLSGSKLHASGTPILAIDAVLSLFEAESGPHGAAPA